MALFIKTKINYYLAEENLYIENKEAIVDLSKARYIENSHDNNGCYLCYGLNDSIFIHEDYEKICALLRKE